MPATAAAGGTAARVDGKIRAWVEVKAGVRTRCLMTVLLSLPLIRCRRRRGGGIERARRRAAALAAAAAAAPAGATRAVAVAGTAEGGLR
jgi:hypothetical protein